MNPDTPALPLCPVCKRPVSLETAKTDALGRAIHGECYLQTLRDSAGVNNFQSKSC